MLLLYWWAVLSPRGRFFCDLLKPHCFRFAENQGLQGLLVFIVCCKSGGSVVSLTIVNPMLGKP